MTTVHPKAFNGLFRLTRLDLNDNQQLQTLPDNVFDTLSTLATLSLQNNRLTNFPVKSLAKAVGGRKMSTLSLSNNPNLPCNVKQEILSHIQTPGSFNFPSPCVAERCPTPLPCTCQGKEIRCNKLGLIEVPLFEFSDSYTWLYLYENDIEEVPDNAFRNLPNLEYLSIDNNELMNVHPNAFNGLSRLEDLDLYNNQLQTLPYNVFHNLTNLAMLSLHSNKLTTAHTEAFNGLSRLEYLYLDNNQLQTLPDNVFDTLTELSWLSLNNNNLAKFPVQSLTKAVGGRKMGNLYLSSNPNLPCNLKHEIRAYIQTPATFEFPSPCGVQPTCSAPLPCTCDGTDMSCERKELTTVPVFQFTAAVTWLRIYRNSIETLPQKSFENLPNLKKLSIHNNKIVSIHPEAFDGLSQLETLSLTNNKLRTLPDTVFDPFTKLSQLYVHNNQLTNFPVTSLSKAANGTQMELLNLDINPQLPCDIKQKILDAMEKPREFKFPKKCQAQACPAPSPCTCEGKTIRCDKLRLTEVPKFEFSDSQKKLHLYNNDIEEVPENAFRNLPNLEYLSFTDNKLTTVHPKAFNGLSRLEYLYLYNNQLQTLPDNVFDTLTKVSWLSLHNNNLTNFPVQSLEEAVGGRKMDNLYMSSNAYLPCKLKHEILSHIKTPATFEFPSRCASEPAV